VTRWAIRIGTTEFPIDELPIAKIQDIASTYGISWMTLIDYPVTHSLAYLNLLGVVCELHPEAGAVELGDITSSAGAVRALTDMIVPVEDDMPTQWVDGDPKVEDSPETAG
jgi:hypothetical protein